VPQSGLGWPKGVDIRRPTFCFARVAEKLRARASPSPARRKSVAGVPGYSPFVSPKHERGKIASALVRSRIPSLCIAQNPPRLIESLNARPTRVVNAYLVQ